MESIAVLLNQLNNAIKAKRLHLAKKKVFFHHNTFVYIPLIAVAKLYELRFELIPHVFTRFSLQILSSFQT